ncbi:hypothetical protein MG293_020630 [Ovis ammon polii]|uniref:Tumor suppressor candidate 2 n=1 Tax=Ovis ammon polii TaxID=230172 RepID=A0AAD4TJR9_OVIAM|nr:hypothetical protein MG293_020630 [Ovis ammon polii]
MFCDEDGDLAHEFYEETIITKNGQKRAKLRRVHKNLIPQGTVKLDPPRIHVDFPVILYEPTPAFVPVDTKQAIPDQEQSLR